MANSPTIVLDPNPTPPAPPATHLPPVTLNPNPTPPVTPPDFGGPEPSITEKLKSVGAKVVKAAGTSLEAVRQARSNAAQKINDAIVNRIPNFSTMPKETQDNIRFLAGQGMGLYSGGLLMPGPADVSNDAQHPLESIVPPFVPGEEGEQALREQGEINLANRKASQVPEAKTTHPTEINLVKQADGSFVFPKSLPEHVSFESVGGKEVAPPPKSAPVSPKTLEPDTDIPHQAGYVYHATNEERLHDIADSGLQTHKPREYTDQSAWPDGSVEKRSYFTPNPNSAYQFSPEEGKPVLLRMQQDPAIHKPESTGDIYAKKTIPAQKLQVLGDDNQWHPVSNTVAQEQEENGKLSVPATSKFELAPTGVMKIPDRLLPEGWKPQDVLEHELAHTVIARIHGFNPEEVISHNSARHGVNGAIASTQFDPDDVGLEPNGTMPPENIETHLPRIIDLLMAGGAANEAYGGIPHLTNSGMDGDNYMSLRMLLKDVGMNPMEADDYMETAFGRTKAILENPQIKSIIQDAAKTREAKLDPTLHYSAARVREITSEAVKAHESYNQANIGSNAPNGTENVPGAKTPVEAKVAVPTTKIEEVETPPDWLNTGNFLRLKLGIPRDESISTNVPISQLAISKEDFNDTSSDIAKKQGSRTKGPVSVFYDVDHKQFLVEDGMHRVVEAYRKGQTTIPAKLWSGYSDYIANVRPESRMDLSPTRYR